MKKVRGRALQLLKRHRTVILTVVIALAAGLCAGAAAATNGIGAAPAPGGCLPVHNEWILASDLGAANPVFGALDAEMAVGAAPMAGARRVFRAAELARLARENHLPAGSFHDICFEWPEETIAPDRFRKSMAAVLRVEPDAIEIMERSRVAAPPGDLIFAKDDLRPVSGSDGREALWKGFVRYAPARRFPVWARIRVVAPVPRVIANGVLVPGEPVQETALERVVIPHGIVNGIYASSVDEVAGRVPRIRIEPGAAIRLSDLTWAPEIRAGDEVQVEIRKGAMRIHLVARAENSGRTGDRITLTNPASSAHFHARVDSRNRAVVTLQPTQGW
jgi:flagella basal body P-ring formation protein FlgA